MSVIFMNLKCRDCAIRLSEYEVSDKRGLCIDCYKDQQKEAKNPK
jgi:hypothetical protein